MSARWRVATNLALAAIIIMLGLGSWWLWGRQLPLVGYSTSRIAGEQGRSPADPLAIAELGGVEEPHAAIRTLGGLRALHTLTDAELAAYHDAGASRVNVAVSNYAGSNYAGSNYAGSDYAGSDYDAAKATVIVARTRSASMASRTADTLNELQHSYGFRPGELRLPGAAILPANSDGLPGGRAHYSHDDLLVRVAFRGPNASASHRKFAELLHKQLEVLPASE